MLKASYKMMASGVQSHVQVLGKIFKLPKVWKAPYYSKMNYVVGIDEEACLNKIRPKMIKKYIGFRIFEIKEVE